MMTDRTRTLQLTAPQIRYLRAANFGTIEGVRLGDHHADRVIHITPNGEKKLIEALADRLQQRGFDVDYDPTVEGAMLESIIDVLASGQPPT